MGNKTKHLLVIRKQLPPLGKKGRAESNTRLRNLEESPHEMEIQTSWHLSVVTEELLLLE